MVDSDSQNSSAVPERRAVDTPTHVPETTQTVAAGIAETAGHTGDLLQIEALEDETDKTILRAACSFLQSSGEKSPADIRFHAAEVGNVIEGYDMTGGVVPDVISNLYARLEMLRRQRHIADAREELKQSAPDLLKLLYCVRMASDNAAAIPAAICEDLDRLKTEIASRNLRSETYDQMCALSNVVAESLPHLAEQKNIRLAQQIVSALVSGAIEHIDVAMKLVPRLRIDAGKNGAGSRAALHTIADRIEECARRLMNVTR